MRFFDYKNNIHAGGILVGEQVQRLLKVVRDLDRLQFINELKKTPAAEIPELIDLHLRQFLRKGGRKADFLKELESVNKEMGRNKLTSKQEDAFLCWMEAADYKAKSEMKNAKQQNQKAELQAPEVKLFCAIVHQTKIQLRGFDESAEEFCKSICKRFNLPYPTNARKSFNHEAEIKTKDRSLKKVKELIMPQLTEDVRVKIEQYINSKTELFT